MTDFEKTCRKRRKTDFFHPQEWKPKIKKPKLDESFSSKINSSQQLSPQPLRRVVPRDDLLVWGRLRGFGWWPGRIANRSELSGPIDPPEDPTRWIKWFGDGKYTETKVDQMAYFHDFVKFFKERSYYRNQLYQKAVDEAIAEACKRAEKSGISKEGGLNWAKDHFLPEGYMKLLPKLLTPAEMDSAPLLNGPMSSTQPTLKRKNKMLLQASENSANDQDFSEQRKMALEKVQDGVIGLDQLCLCCGSLGVACEHPLFAGGICSVCEENYREYFYLLDEGGGSCYCCVCSGGKEVLLCDNTNCCRCFCTSCLELFIGQEAAKKEMKKCPWICFLCIENDTHGLLKRKENCHQNLQKFMNNEKSALNFEILSLPKTIPPSQRKPIKVLSLFDGISTGLLALHEIEIKVDCYYACEIDHEAICVSEVRFPAQVKHVGDATEITDKMLAEWGPFDLVIGGSPCNDLSIVNPARKGIWSDKGSGKLFFEFVRILRSCQLLSASCNKPLFWLFENVVYMDRSSRQTISHFLQKSPVVLDAKYVSPAHRPRCFWGNLPGMNRPMVASGHHRLNLQECLEPGRVAQTQKLRTITTNLNSVSKRCVASGGNKEVSVLNSAVVLHPGNQLDTLWITEIERVFGFPDHYTDVRNMARAARLRVLGKAWSVPVIKHLFAPLKDFFSCSD